MQAEPEDPSKRSEAGTQKKRRAPGTTIAWRRGMKTLRLLSLCALSALSLVACGSSNDSPGSAGSGDTAGNGGSNATGGAAGSNAAGGSAGSGAGGSAGAAGGTGGSAGSAGSGGAAGAGGNAGAGGGNASFKPCFFDDFESYSDGASLSNNQPFDAAGHTTASSEQARRGKQSAKMEIHSGDGGGFGKWGGIIPIKPALAKGQEVWVRLWVYWPSSFQFTASPWMKFLRLHNQTSSGQNGGYNDLYVDQADSTTSVLRTIKEFDNNWAVYDGPKLPRDTWERYEMYLYIDNKSVDQGGKGRVRIWRDDELIFNRTDVPTITESGGTINSFYLFTYWNNEQPTDNYCYVDDLAIATSASPPPNKDAQGNAYIGDW